MFHRKNSSNNLRQNGLYPTHHVPTFPNGVVHKNKEGIGCVNRNKLEEFATRSAFRTENSSTEERILTPDMGGEIADLIIKLGDLKYNCIGTLQNHDEFVGTWYGYPHSSGLTDSSGKRWWAYQKCSVTQYKTVWWKVKTLLKHQIELELHELSENKDAGRKTHPHDEVELPRAYLDYYSILFVDCRAFPDEIKRVYRDLVKLYHPDITSCEQSYAARKMKNINEAYAVLSDPIKRFKYDEHFLKPIKKQHNFQLEPVVRKASAKQVRYARFLLVQCRRRLLSEEREKLWTELNIQDPPSLHRIKVIISLLKLLQGST